MTPRDATSTGEPVTVRLLLVPCCPFAAHVRAMVHDCVREAATPALVEEVEGQYPSPTVLVNGADVVTGIAPADGASCRLNLPTRAHILNALNAPRRNRS